VSTIFEKYEREANIKQTVRKWLREWGFYVFPSTPTGIGASTVDDICCIYGFFVAIEYKSTGKQPTARQKLIMGAIERAGGIAIWGDSAGSIIHQISTHPKIKIELDKITIS
jgi:hypothetical protein